MGVIQLHNVSKIYSGNIVAIQDVSFRVEKGEFVFLTGSSGAGKSTLLKLLFIAEEVSKGQIFIHGRCLEKIRASSVPYLRRNIGVVFQDFKLLPNRTVFENIALALEVIGMARREVEKRVRQVASFVELSAKLDYTPQELSGGEKQRVAIARAIANEPMILLADEPTGNLDDKITASIMDLFRYINARGITIMIATHDHALVRRLQKRVIHIERGRVVSDAIASAEFGL
jgi:cell division transport system ATP-binding protein